MNEQIKVIKPPNPIYLDRELKDTTIFLAGSIEMGKAFDYQLDVTEYLKLYSSAKITIFNPRRDDWDISWEQKYSNPYFYQQVMWELNALDKSDFIIMYFDPDTLSPISLLELGLYANSDKMVVCCPDGFWRKGNVQITCEKYGVPFFDTIDQMKKFILDKLK